MMSDVGSSHGDPEGSERNAALARPPHARALRDRHPIFVASQWLVAGVLHALADVEVTGAELCPKSGPVILASNHLSYVDIPFIGAWAPRSTIYFSKHEVQHWPVVGFFASTYGTVFVRRGESDRQAMRDALGFLSDNRVIGVFPEGTRSKRNGMRTAQPGIALLAQRSGAIVWPVGVTGTERVFNVRRPKITLTGGEPFDPLAAARAEHGDRPSHQQVTDTIMRRVATLLPGSYRGVYGTG